MTSVTNLISRLSTTELTQTGLPVVEAAWFPLVSAAQGNMGVI